MPEQSLGQVLVTGAAGSVGQALLKRLWNRLRPGEPLFVATDVVRGGERMEYLDVTNPNDVLGTVRYVDPDTVFHLAGAKHAPEGEENAFGYTQVNIMGTDTVIAAANSLGKPRVILASTCKACDPETVYGATKLVAERMTLEAGHSVARFHNVIQSSGNVFEIWEGLPDDAPIPVTDCKRRFITMDEAVGLLLYAADPANDAGRYSVFPTQSRFMPNVAWEKYPKRDIVTTARRRGDRIAEPGHAAHERAKGVKHGFGVAQILSDHDPQ